MLGMIFTLRVFFFSALERDGFEFLSEDDVTKHNGSYSLWVSEAGERCSGYHADK